MLIDLIFLQLKWQKIKLRVKRYRVRYFHRGYIWAICIDIMNIFSRVKEYKINRNQQFLLIYQFYAVNVLIIEEKLRRLYSYYANKSLVNVAYLLQCLVWPYLKCAYLFKGAFTLRNVSIMFFGSICYQV